MRRKEHPVVIKSYKNTLLLQTLHFPYELREPEEVEKVKEEGKLEVSEEEINLSKELVKKLSGEFNIGEFEDKFEDAIKEVIEKRAKGEEVEIKKEEKEKKGEEGKLKEKLEASLKTSS